MHRYSAAEAARIIPLWPFLAAFSANFRREVRRALFGRNDGMVRPALQLTGAVAAPHIKY